MTKKILFAMLAVALALPQRSLAMDGPSSALSPSAAAPPPAVGAAASHAPTLDDLATALSSQLAGLREGVARLEAGTTSVDLRRLNLDAEIARTGAVVSPSASPTTKARELFRMIPDKADDGPAAGAAPPRASSPAAPPSLRLSPSRFADDEAAAPPTDEGTSPKSVRPLSPSRFADE